MGVKQNKKESKKSLIKRKKQREISIIKAIEKNIPEEKTTMLYQPYGITMLKGDLSPMKVNMMVELIERFQDKMKEQLYNKAHNIQANLFDDGKIPIIKIPFRDLDVLPKHYAELHTAAKELLTLTYEYTTVNDDGITMTNISPLFSRISIPQKTIESNVTDSKERYNYKENKRRMGYIEVAFNPEVGIEALTIDKSFTRYIKEMTRNRRCVYTARLYMFMSTYCNLGKWKIDYQEFRKLLGFTVLKEESNGQMVEEIVQYPNFSDVKRRVLEPPMQELKELAQEGKVNCYFEYEPIYSGVKKRGNPEYLLFHIYKTDLGRVLDAQTESVKEIEEISNFLQVEFHINARDTKSLCRLISNENKNGFRKKMLDIKTYVTNPKNNIRDPKVYALTALRNWLQDSIPVAEEIKDGIQAPQVNQKPVESIEPKEEVVELSSEDNDKWNTFLAGIKEDVTKKDFETWFVYINLLKVEGNVLTLGVPNSFFLEWLDKNFKEPYRNNLIKAFGADTMVKYIIQN